MRERIFVGDFETTVYEGQTSTEVWASAVVELNTEDVVILHSITDTWEYLKSLKSNVIIYYHNLKFDGAFWLNFFLKHPSLKQGLVKISDNEVDFVDRKELENNVFTYSISDMGMWYNIVVRVDGHIIEFRDSSKLLPFSVEKIGNDFKTKHRKLDMEYTGYRYAGCNITPQEKEYIANDVLVVKEALEIMFEQGHTKLTIGSCCFAEFKKLCVYDYDDICPDLTTIECPFDGYANADDYIRKTYHGGWCYVAKGKENIRWHNGMTLDVNSLYPSVMHSKSGSRYPVGKPRWFTGAIPEEAKQSNKYFFVHVRTKFHIRPNHLPTIQIKNSLLYKANDWLESSDVVLKDGRKLQRYKLFGQEYDTRVDLYLTMTDYELLHTHYYLDEYEEIDGCYFNALTGIFDPYIDKYAQIKMNSKGAIRQLAKLFLNNLYGKLASSDISSFKYAHIKEDGSLGFEVQTQRNKRAGYIAIGSAITGYARYFTITTAQKNYKYFIYADTDSIHCNTDEAHIQGVTLHPTEFCCWKHESSWDEAVFVRQKTYIEHIVESDGEPIEQPFYDIKCAGMPKRCKQLFAKSMGEDCKIKNLTEDEDEWCATARTLKDFAIGLLVPSKLRPKQIDGGVLLVETTYKMR